MSYWLLFWWVDFMITILNCKFFNLFMSIKHIKKETPGSHNTAIHWAIYWHKPVYIFASQGSSSSEHEKYTFFLYYYICLPLCAHIL